jgi:mitogen-activated protein kinase 1/3
MLFRQIPTRYSFVRPIGHGAYGVVISALDKESGQKVAIKKISRAFEDPVDAKRILREIKLMKKFSHENVSDFSNLEISILIGLFSDYSNH